MQNHTHLKTYRVLLEEKRGRAFSEFEVAHILKQALKQLTQLHSQGQTHGAISLDTLSQDEQAEQVILTQSSGLTSSNYLPPEHSSTDLLNAGDDLYALGVTMTILLTNQLPEQLRQPNGRWNWENYSLVSDQFAVVLNRAIAPQPHLRFTQAVEMLQALNLQPSATTIPTTQLTPTSTKRPSFSPWQYSAVGAGIALVLGGLGFSLFSPKTETASSVVGSLSASSSAPIESTSFASSSIVGNAINTSKSSTPQPSTSLEAQSSSPSQPSPVSSPISTYRSRNEPQQAQSTPRTEATETKQISFADNATGTTIRGAIDSRVTKRYLLNCGKGQRFTLRINQGNVNVNVMSSNGQVLGTAENEPAEWQGILPSTGDYVVEVSSTNGLNSASYNISVNVL